MIFFPCRNPCACTLRDFHAHVVERGIPLHAVVMVPIGMAAQSPLFQSHGAAAMLMKVYFAKINRFCKATFCKAVGFATFR